MPVRPTKTPPAPPANVDPIEPVPPEGDKITIRQRIEAHTKDPNCAACHKTIDPLAQQYSGFAPDVASVTVDREHNSNTNQEHLSQMEKSSSLNDNIYIKSYNKIKKENDSETGTSSAVTVATVATLQHSCGVAGYSRCDTSETVATVENPHNSKAKLRLKYYSKRLSNSGKAERRQASKCLRATMLINFADVLRSSLRNGGRKSQRHK